MITIWKASYTSVYDLLGGEYTYEKTESSYIVLNSRGRIVQIGYRWAFSSLENISEWLINYGYNENNTKLPENWTLEKRICQYDSLFQFNRELFPEKLI
jgi:hypothetical protein